MPAIVAFFARQLIIIGVQLGLFTLIDRFVTPLLNKALTSIVSTFGVDENVAADILANEVLTVAESLGLTVALSKARLPLALADKLGFTTKGFSKRTIRSDVAPKVAAKAGTSVGVVGSVAVPTAAEATIIVEAMKGKKLGFAAMLGLTLGVLGVINLAYMNLINTLDFGTWESSAYKDTFQKLFNKITFGLLKPDEDFRKTKTVSPEVFSKVYETYKANGAYAINDPFKKASVLFTRDTLIDLLDKVGAQLLQASGGASTKQVILASQLMIQFPVDATAPTVAVPTATKPAAQVIVPSVKIFTGIVSQGVLGASLPFAPRPDDLIESASELQEAATNNLAATLAALPGSLSYEIKIVPSIITREGFKQTGTSQQLLAGYSSDGTPRYKTIVNKFATLAVYLVNEKGTRTKVRTIVLGPTNVLKFNPTPGQLSGIETTVKSTIATSSVSDIVQVAGSAPLAAAVIEPEEAGVELDTSPPLTEMRGDTVVYITDPTYTGPGANKVYNILGKRIKALTECAAASYAVSHGWPISEVTRKYCGLPRAAKPKAEIPAVVAPATASPSICSAKTLWELSQAQGVPLPTVEARAPEYEALGLGQAALYTGTAEQNIKLLAALKAKYGCIGGG